MSNWEWAFSVTGYLLAGVGIAGILLDDLHKVETGPRWVLISLFWPVVVVFEGIAFLGDVGYNVWIRVWGRP